MMEDNYQSAGSTTIATDVLLTIAQLTTLSEPGVSRLSPLRGKGMELLLKHGQARDGINIEITDDIVYADIYVILKNDINVRDASHNIQRDVARAISEMVGMQVGRINIHIEDIDYPTGG
jgi:uncharacterized alkaline shock family protein YloU